MPVLQPNVCIVNCVKRVGSAFHRRSLWVNCSVGTTADFRCCLEKVRHPCLEISCSGRPLHRAFSSKNEEPSLDPNIEQYLSSQNVLESVQKSSNMTMLKKQKLYSRIVRSLESVYGKHKITVENLQAFGSTGLKALAASICREEPSLLEESVAVTENENIPFVTVRFKVPHHQTEFDIPWYYASSSSDQKSSLLDLSKSSNIGAELLSEYMEASCGGNGSCSTCHVYIDYLKVTDSAESLVLSDATEAELDMISLAYQPTDQSRLACQVRLLKVPRSMNCVKQPALTVVIPPGVNNFWN